MNGDKNDFEDCYIIVNGDKKKVKSVYVRDPSKDTNVDQYISFGEIIPEEQKGKNFKPFTKITSYDELKKNISKQSYQLKVEFDDDTCIIGNNFILNNNKQLGHFNGKCQCGYECKRDKYYITCSFKDGKYYEADKSIIKFNPIVPFQHTVKYYDVSEKEIPQFNLSKEYFLNRFTSQMMNVSFWDDIHRCIDKIYEGAVNKGEAEGEGVEKFVNQKFRTGEVFEGKFHKGSRIEGIKTINNEKYNVKYNDLGRIIEKKPVTFDFLNQSFAGVEEKSVNEENNKNTSHAIDFLKQTFGPNANNEINNNQQNIDSLDCKKQNVNYK